MLELRRGGPARLLALVVVVGAMLATFAATAPAASAHAVLQKSSPADGAVLKKSPPQVTLTFDENVTLPPNAVVVLDSAKHRVDTGDVHAGKTGAEVVVGLKPNLAKGSYLVAWHVISADTHPVQGGVVFSVGAPGPTASLSAANHVGEATEWKVAEFVARGFAFVALFFVAGAVFYLLWIGDARRPTVSRLLGVAVIVGVVALAAQVPFVAAQATGQGLGALGEHGVLGDTLRNGMGWSILAGVGGLVIARLAAALRARRLARGVALVGFAGMAASFLLVGHTRSTSPTWLTVLSELCHISAGAVWFGGLVLLALDLHARRREAAPRPVGAGVLEPEAAVAETSAAHDAAALVRRFSGVATVAVLAVIVAGGVLGYLEVRSLHGLLDTAYGRLLIAKVSVVAIVALIGGYNHYRLVPAVDRFGDADSRQWRHLGGTVRVEAVLLVAVLCLTAVLGNLVPGRKAAASPKLFTGTASFGANTINVVVDPAHVGTNVVHFYILDQQGRPTNPTSSIQVQLTLPSEGLGPITKVPFKAGPGHYQVVGLQVPIAGTWTMTVTGAISEFSNDDATFRVPFSP